MPYQAVRKFNGACDPHWSTPEGQSEWGGYATFDHHLGGGSFQDAINAARAFFGPHEIKWAKERHEYDAIMAELNNPQPRNFSFVFNQDLFEISGTSDVVTGVRNFSDPRLSKKKGWLW